MSMESISPVGVREALDRDGYAILPAVFDAHQVRSILTGLESALATGTHEGPAIRGTSGIVYAARNVLRVWPACRDAWQRPILTNLLKEILGPGCGLVRALFFDKPPGNSWALPWHKDLTVAVRDNRRGGSRFTKPTRKAGVPHLEAPQELLESMLTIRIHLDDVTDENGPLKVIPGSHRTGKTMILDNATIATLHVAAGDVLLMRPLLAHCSNRSAEETTRHRRILHLELASSSQLPDGYEWHEFVSLRKVKGEESPRTAGSAA